MNERSLCFLGPLFSVLDSSVKKVSLLPFNLSILYIGENTKVSMKNLKLNIKLLVWLKSLAA